LGGPEHDVRALEPAPGPEPVGLEPPDRDEILAGRASRGDPVALSRLLVRWESPVRRYCRRILRHEDDARDLAQDVLMRVSRGLPSFDTSRPFAPWIYRIARNACLHHLDRERLRRPAGPSREAEEPAPPPDVLVARREEVARARAALSRLPQPDRQLLELKLVKGLTNAELTEHLGLTPGALRTRACRALGRLRSALDATDREVRR